MLDKKTFAIGIGLIVTLIGDKANHIKGKQNFDILYGQLIDLNPKSFIAGISNMIKNEDIKFFPSVYLIRKYVLAIDMHGYSLESLLELAEVRKLTNKPYKNKLFDNLIMNIDIESSNKENLLIVKKGYVEIENKN